MTIDLEPIVEQLRERCTELARANKLPLATIVGRLWHEMQKIEPTTIDDIATVCALSNLRSEVCR